jgi:KDO2-lipid IV(A) lauroyltransferase
LFSESPLQPAGEAPPFDRAGGSDKGLYRQTVRRHRQHQTSATSITLNLGGKVIFCAMVAGLHALSLLPDFVLYPLGIVGGWLGYLLDGRHVRVGLCNLAFAFPDKSPEERRRILRASYVNLGLSAAEYVRLGGVFYRRLKRRVKYSRFGYWAEMNRRYPGKGVVILTAHFGNFELLPAAHALHGYPITLVHHTQRFLAGDALMTYVRERAGVKVIRKHAAARAVLKSLKAGELVGIPFDQNAKRSEAVFVPFFDELAATSSGLARLVAIAEVPVVPVFLLRQRNWRQHRIEILDEIPIQRSSDARVDIEENTRRFTNVIEGFVRRHPTQFLWTHRRYRTRPRGMAPVYD